MGIRYNYLGECIDNIEPELLSPEYGHINEDRALIIHWDADSANVDKYGFDKSNIESNGQYIEEVELPKGTLLCRYGSNNGRVTTLQGSRYELLGLPYKKETVEYHEYVVSADGVSVKCIVTKGKVASMFNSPGGAIQFLHERSIKEEQETDRLKEVTTWLKKKK